MAGSLCTLKSGTCTQVPNTDNSTLWNESFHDFEMEAEPLCSVQVNMRPG
jgi:hypothetical protein